MKPIDSGEGGAWANRSYGAADAPARPDRRRWLKRIAAALSALMLIGLLGHSLHNLF